MREAELLKYVYGVSGGGGGLGEAVRLGPGDDMGAVTVEGRTVLVTVDQVVDGVHVDLSTMTVEQVGRKAMMRNLSDVAAMAALPVGAVAAVSLPGDFGEDRAKRLFEAMRAAGEAYGCPLFGGDISMWEGKLVCSVTVLAEAAGIEPMLRRGAQVGDGIYVTGELGGSLETVGGRAHHLDFEPRIEVARKLAGDVRTRPHCMIDLSDGLGRDLGHLCAAGGTEGGAGDGAGGVSGVGAEVEVERLPVSAGARQAAGRDGRAAWQHAVGDGEDYELLFTAVRGTAGDEVEGVRVTQVGRIVAGSGVRFVSADGRRVWAGEPGWEHQG